jgi:lysophospholipase L1-like esterase
MNHTPNRLAAVFLAVVGLASSAFAGDFIIHNNDRVVILGDSITEQKLYSTYVEAYALTRHPDWKLTFRNTGWGGDTSWLRQRARTDENALFKAEPDEQQKMVENAVNKGLERDVLPLKPTVVTIDFAMNDHAYQPFREDIFRAYVRSENQLTTVLKASGARVALLTTQPIEDKRPDPDKDVRNQSLRKFSDGLKEVATKQNVVFVDQFDPYMSIMMRERAANPSAIIGGGDAVHPGPAGHTIMAWAILKGLGADALVSRADIDAAAKKVVASEKCRIENLKSENGSISFDRTDEALPMPIDTRAQAALKLAPILDELSRYELCVSGLASGNYELSIDGENVGKVTAEDLAKGWNLSNQSGPIKAQGLKVLELVFKKNDVFFNRWRNVQLYQLPDWAKDAEKGRAAECARLDQEIAGLEAQIDAARKIKTHHFELKAAQ